MKKILIVIFILIIGLINISSVSAVSVGPPEPNPPASCNDYQFIGTQNNWHRSGIDARQIINQVGLARGNSFESTPLGVNYDLRGTATRLGEVGGQDRFNVALYALVQGTDHPECNANPYSDKLYVLASSDNRIFDIVWRAQPGDCDYAAFDQHGNPTHCFHRTHPNSDDLRSHWVYRYIAAIQDGIRSNHPAIGAAPPVSGVDCAGQFAYLLANLKDLRDNSYYLLTNGCETATPENPCSPDQARRYFRPKTTGESIPDVMIVYQTALKEIIAADPGGVLAALARQYTIDEIIFTDEGIQKLQTIGNDSINISKASKILEASCPYYTDPNKNGTDPYPVYIPKYLPTAPQQRIDNWAQLKEIIQKSIKIGQVAGLIPTTTVSGPLSQNGWLTNAINWIKCILRNMFIVILQWEANAMGWFLRRNY